MTPVSVTVQDAVKMYGIGRSKIYELIASKEIDAVKIGARTLILTKSVDRLLESRQKQENAA